MQLVEKANQPCERVLVLDDSVPLLRADMRRRDLAPSRYHGECNPAFTSQFGQLRDSAAGARMIERAHHLQWLAAETLVIEIAQAVHVVTQPDSGFAPPDQVAYLRAGRCAQRQIGVGMPVRIVGAAAGKITVKARLMVPTSSVRATLIHSLRTLATPKAVLSSIGHTEQMKMTKIAEIEESLMV